MSIILSISQNDKGAWAAGPEGLFLSNGNGLDVVPQPESQLYCCCAIHDRVLVGGLPHGVAYSLNQQGDDWKAGWVDSVEASVITFAADPAVESSGIILAGTDGGGILRSVNRGAHWFTRNFGLQTFTVLSIVWAPVAPKNMWPRWRYVFAGTEEGIYHSPNAGRGWKRSECEEAVYQILAVSPDFHEDGIVMAGTEESGLHRSEDRGHSFTRVESAPHQVNALAAVDDGWVLSDSTGLWRSEDGRDWQAIPDTAPALTLARTTGGVLAGGESGVTLLEL
jgi:hypothetical protein